MTGLDWVDEGCALLLAPDPAMDAVAAWLGAAAGPERVLADRPARVGGALHVVVFGAAGVPDSLTARWAPGAGPLVADVEGALGPSRELPRGAAGPFQLAWPAREGEIASCFVAVTTPDPPGARERRVSELMLRRDPRR